MPATVAWNLLRRQEALYAGYESQVNAGIRTPARSEHDRQRAAVGGVVFGSYAKEIRYGVLSLDNLGVRNYGPVHCRLRERAVAHRVTFMEENSFHFVERHGLTPSDSLPAGYRAVWRERDKLASTKLEPQLAHDQTAEDWAQLLVKNGRNRSEDEFVEAHVFGSFNKDSVERIEIDEATSLSDHERFLCRHIRSWEDHP